MLERKSIYLIGAFAVLALGVLWLGAAWMRVAMTSVDPAPEVEVEAPAGPEPRYATLPWKRELGSGRAVDLGMARLPWVRTSRSAESVKVDLAVLPWVADAAHPKAVMVPTADLPAVFAGRRNGEGSEKRAGSR